MNRIANVLTRDLGLVPGHRVLLRAPNSAMMVAAYLAVIKAGGVVVATMPLLRAKELAYPLAKAKIALALCDARLADEMEKGAGAVAPRARSASVYWGARRADALEALMAKPGYETLHRLRHRERRRLPDRASPPARPASRRAPCTSTATCWRPATAMAQYVLRAERDDRFIGSPPLAFTFGLGGLVLFPLRVGAATDPAWSRPRRTICSPAIAKFRATICVHRADRLSRDAGASFPSTTSPRCANASPAGEALPKATFDAWQAATGIKILDGIGATEMLHIFIGSPRARDPRRRDRQGRCRATRRSVIDDDGNEVAARHDRRASPCAGRPAAAISPTTRQTQIRAGRLERHRRHLPDGCRRLLLVPGALRRHDRLGRLQHRRPRGRVRAAGASRGRRMRRGRRRRTRSAARSSRPMWCCAPGQTGDAAMTSVLQDYVKADDRAHTNIRAPSNTCTTLPQHADRQAATLRAAPHRG